MDPVTATAIVAALSAGAAKAATSALSDLGKDAYSALKERILKVVKAEQVTTVERAPDEIAARSELISVLREHSDQSAELVRLAKALTAALAQDASNDDVTIEHINAANVLLGQVESAGGFTARNIDAAGDFKIESLKTGKK